VQFLLFESIIGYFALSIAASFLATRRGRNGFIWFAISILFTPVVAFAFILSLDDLDSITIKVNAKTHTRCPECREYVLNSASKCKHCGSALGVN
jgi:hypothetical protein